MEIQIEDLLDKLKNQEEEVENRYKEMMDKMVQYLHLMDLK